MGLTRFAADVVARLKAMPVDLSALPSEAVRGSICTGAAGVAFFLLEVARLRGDEGALALARMWLGAGRRWAETATVADWRQRPDGVVTGEVGLSYIGGLLSSYEGDSEGVLASALTIERALCGDTGASRSGRLTELLGGAAGVACAVTELESRVPTGMQFDETRRVLARVRKRETERVLERYLRPVPFARLDSIGIAHGIAGELWALVMLLGAKQEVVGERLAELAALRQVDEDGLVYWSMGVGREPAPDLLGTWCNGTAGHTLLWCEVARQLESSEFAELAAKCAESSAILAGVNPSLCCGLAGQAIALDRYAALSGDRRFGRRAYERLLRATTKREDTPFLSLWYGALGVALVAMRRAAGETTFPCVEGRRYTRTP